MPIPDEAREAMLAEAIFDGYHLGQTYHEAHPDDQDDAQGIAQRAISAWERVGYTVVKLPTVEQIEATIRAAIRGRLDLPEGAWLSTAGFSGAAAAVHRLYSGEPTDG